MAAYFHGNSELQGGGDGLQTLILMNPGYVGYSDTQPPPPGGSNFVFLNSNNLSHVPSSQTQQFVGIPLQATTSTTTTLYQDTQPQQDLSAFNGFLPRVQYNPYNSSMDLTEPCDVTRAQQGLSLSLSSQYPPGGFGSFRPEGHSPSQPLVAAKSSVRRDNIRVSGESPLSVSGVSNGITGMQSVLTSSKYLKAAQELLEEVVNVGKEVKSATKSGKSTLGQAKSAVGESSAATNSAGETSGKHGAELTTAERQEIQMKKAKFVNMLNEVEQRYAQYHHQMQVVIATFEQAAGIGSAKTYTALALQTISKQFRCLKDAILGQIRSAGKSLGEEENLGGKVEGSRLKYVDNHIRQQKALQQLGMIQHNAWRPQRGLPEHSVSVLRAWLFEHFLHPYPKDSDKHTLAKQTGLTRSQVSNWFINARVRLWKPMVEEMYVEEMKEHKSNGSEEKTSKSGKNEESALKSKAAPQENSPGNENQNKNFIAKQDKPINQSISTSSTSPTDETFKNNQSGFNLIGTSEIESITRGSRKKPCSSVVPSTNMDSNSNSTDANNDQIAMKFINEGQSRDGFTLIGGGFGLYPMGEIGRFGTEQFQAPYTGNGTVSLTLGLPHCENLSSAHQTFLPNHSIRGVEIEQTNAFNGTNTPTSAHSTSMFGNINIQDRKRLAEQLLPDFVA